MSDFVEFHKKLKDSRGNNETVVSVHIRPSSVFYYEPLHPVDGEGTWLGIELRSEAKVLSVTETIEEVTEILNKVGESESKVTGFQSYKPAQPTTSGGKY